MATSLSKAQNERLRRAMLEVKDREYKGVVSALARAMGRAQPSLQRFLAGSGGANMETVERFARIVRKPPFEIIGPYNEQPGEKLVEEQAPARATPDVRFDDLLDWYYSSRALRQCVDIYREDVMVSDLVQMFVSGRPVPNDPEAVFHDIQRARKVDAMAEAMRSIPPPPVSKSRSLPPTAARPRSLPPGVVLRRREN